MHPRPLFAVALGFVALLTSPLQAQLVHLAFRDANSSVTFKADDINIPWNQTGGTITRLDIFYDISTAVGTTSDVQGDYTFNDPTRDVWRAEVRHFLLGTFEIIRPLQSLTVWQDSFMFTHAIDDGVVWEMAEFEVHYTGAGATPFMLPVSPLEVTQTHFFIHGTESFFDVPHIGEAYGSASFNQATVRFADRVDFYPVPEPSTYAFGGAALALAAILVSRRRRRTTPGLCASGAPIN